jgi:hypothetical protein
MLWKDVAMAPPAGHLCVVEGLLDVHLARSLGMACVMGVGGAFGGLSVQRLARLAASGVREITVVPPDDERGRDGTLSVLETAGSPLCDGVRVSVVDPGLMAGAGDLGELVRRRGRQALRELHAWRMESELYRFVMVPLQ